MSVEYKKIIGRDQSILPEELRARVFGRKSWMYAAVDTEANDWYAWLLLSLSEGTSNMMQLHDLYVKPERRDEGIGSGLLEYAIADVKRAGARSVYYKEIHETEGAIWENASFIKDHGFTMITANEAIDYYDLSKLSDHGKIQQMLRQYGRLKIVRFKDYEALPLRKWRKKLNLGMAALSPKGLELKHSWFYAEESEIKAAVFVKIVRSFQAVITGIFMEEDEISVNSELVRTLLYAYAIGSVISAGCTKLYVMSTDEKEQKAVAELISAPDGCSFATEWIREV